MSDEALRRLLADAAEPRWDDDVRAAAALYEGKRRLRRRRAGAAGAAVAVAVTAVGLGTLVVRPVQAPSRSLVLGCTADLASNGDRAVQASLSGTSLQVSNTSGGISEVVSGATRVMALPGDSVVTLPLSPGVHTVRCGQGEAVQVRVGDPRAQSCRGVSLDEESAIESGDLVQLSAAWIGHSGGAARVRADGPLRRVQMRSGGAVVAEALWHELPGTSTWQLQSLTRCSAAVQ